MHLVISANECLYHARYNEPDKLAATGGVEVTWPVPYWFVDAGALMMLVLLAAIDEGLAGAFIGHPDQKRLFSEICRTPRRRGADRPRADRPPGARPDRRARHLAPARAPSPDRRPRPLGALVAVKPAGARPGRTSRGPRRRTPRAGRRSSASAISSTFSAFCSPLRERLNEPTKAVSSQTHDLRVHEVVHGAGAVGRRHLAGERPRHHVLRAAAASTRCSGSRATGGRPRGSASRRRSRRRRPSCRRSPARACRAPGRVVITGEQIRTRCARGRISFAIRADRSSPCPGVNQARTPSSPRGSTNPVRIDVPGRPQLLEVELERLRDRRRVDDRDTFSCRDHESSVQFIDPVQTTALSRTTYLWCIRSGIAGDRLPLDGQGRDQLARRAPGAAAPGSGSRGRRCRRTACARLARPPAGSRRRRSRAVSAPRLKSYCARSSDASRAVDEGRDRARDLRRLLAAVRQSAGSRCARSSTGSLAARIGETFNFYRDGDARRLPARAGSRRYLDARAAAPAAARRRGARLPRRARLRASRSPRSASSPAQGPAEATATIVHRVLAELWLEEDVLLWNVVPTHPGTATLEPPPERAEVEAGVPFALELARGRTTSSPSGGSPPRRSERPYLRHPSRGGAWRISGAGLLHSRPADAWSAVSPYEDLQRQTGRDQRDWYLVDAEGKTLGPPRDPDRRPPARQGQAAVHAARRHGRLRRRRERREDRRHRQEARREDVLPALGLSGRPARAHAARAARAASRPRCCGRPSRACCRATGSAARS